MGNTLPREGRGAMPWKETGPVLERMRFIEDYLSGFYTITELAVRYGVSRRILHKWLARHDLGGAAGLVDRSRRRYTSLIERATRSPRRSSPFAAVSLTWDR